MTNEVLLKLYEELLLGTDKEELDRVKLYWTG